VAAVEVPLGPSTSALAETGPPRAAAAVRLRLSQTVTLPASAAEQRLIETTATIEAISPTPARYDATAIHLTDASGALYTPLPGPVDRPLHGVLAPGQSTTVELRFEVPREARGLRLSYLGVEVDLSHDLPDEATAAASG
jgi:hypothetical protein